jgi:nitrate reductase NapE component
MKNKQRGLLQKTEPLAGGAICCIAGLLMLVLTFTSLLFTTGMEIVPLEDEMDTCVNRIFEGQESVIYYSDSFFENLVLLAVAVVACRLLLPVVTKLRFRYEAALLIVWTVTMGVIWVYSSQVAPSFDSAYVSESALSFAKGEFNSLAGSYLREYPFQLGYIQLSELILRGVILFGGEPETFLPLEVANVVFLALSYVGLLGTAALLFNDRRVMHITFLMLLFCAQPILSCVFTYGIIAGICFAVWAIFFQALWLKRSRIVYGLLSALCIGFAVLLKSNNLIVLIALVIVAGLRLLRRGQIIKDAAVILVMCLFALSFSPAVKALYEKRSGITMEPGMPYISWIAMGLSESQRAPGWYSNVTSNVKFQELDNDPDALSEYSKEVIRERLTYFKDHPQYTRDFFYRKFVSQFNETTYQSIWNNMVRNQYEEKRPFAAWICGDAKPEVKRYMDVFSQLVFVGVLAALFLMVRRRDYTALILPLTVLGGMLFHLMSEGKSQYILPYFMLMIPAAAWGVAEISGKGLDRVVNWLRERRYGKT